MAVTSSSETLWAEHGLTGLVLFALFGLIVLFIKTLTKKDDQLKEVLDDEREERQRTIELNSQNTNRLSKAIEGLTIEIKKNNLK